jgi:hypothetical protein
MRLAGTNQAFSSLSAWCRRSCCRCRSSSAAIVGVTPSPSSSSADARPFFGAGFTSYRSSAAKKPR